MTPFFKKKLCTRAVVQILHATGIMPALTHNKIVTSYGKNVMRKR